MELSVPSQRLFSISKYANTSIGNLDYSRWTFIMHRDPLVFPGNPQYSQGTLSIHREYNQYS